MMSLAKRETRTLLIGVCSLLAILMYSRILPWRIRTLKERRDASREARAQVDAAVMLVRTRHSVRDSLRLLTERSAQAAGRLLKSTTTAGAGMELAGLLSRLAGEARVQVDIIQPLGDTLVVGPFIRVSARTQFTGDVQGVMEMLSLIEADSVLIAVSKVSLAQSDPTADDAKPEVLRGEITSQALFHPKGTR